MLVKLSTLLKWPLSRQIPSSYEGEGWNFIINDKVDRCDAWVVYQGLYRSDETECPADRVFFFAYEPPAFHSYNLRFLSQFSRVVTSDRQISHPGVIARHQAQPWLAGLSRGSISARHEAQSFSLDHDALNKIGAPTKTRPASAICSRRIDAPGHVARLEFLDLLLQRHDCPVDVYGYGHRPVQDKLDALLPYNFHIVLENSCQEDYWTEKLSDAYLAYCLPLVWGCTNLDRYFPPEAFVCLDHTDPKRAVSQVKQAIRGGISAKQRAAVREARKLVLTEFNLFSEIRRMCEGQSSSPPQLIRLSDENAMAKPSILRRAARLIKDIAKPGPYDYYMRGGWRHEYADSGRRGYN